MAKQPLSLPKLVPNMLTLTAMCMGMLSIQFAISGRWDDAVIAIVIAAFIDAFDGAAARLLKATSQFGAELDTLSDFVCFGVAPSTVLYLWVLQDAGRIGWAAALIFTMATALRLARFNSMEKQKKTAAAKKQALLGGYFTGLPSPIGAGLSIWPMIVSFQMSGHDSFFVTPAMIGAWTVMLAWLMVSRVPTFSTKQLHLPQKLMVPALSGFGVFAAFLILEPWPTLTLMGICYLLSVPAAIYYYNELEKGQDADV